MPNPTTPEFCTVVDVKQMLDVGASGVQHDDGIKLAIQNVTRNMQRHCRRSFLYGERSEFFATSKRDAALAAQRPLTLYLRELKIDSVQPFQVWYSELIVDWAANNGTGELDPTADYSIYTGFNEETSQVNLFIPTISHKRSIKIKYTAGFPVSDNDKTPNLIELPVDLRNACALQSAFAYERWKNRQTGQKQVVTKTQKLDFTVGATEAFIMEVLPTLNSYRYHGPGL